MNNAKTELKPFTALPKRVGIFKIYSVLISANGLQIAEGGEYKH